MSNKVQMIMAKTSLKVINKAKGLSSKVKI